MQTYLFYDIETTGLNKAFDQLLQFAAIRTDMNLNEIERHEFKVKLNPDTVPSPGALLTHHIGIAESAQGLCEYDAIRIIHQLMNTPETISIGYNTLGFDDEFLRFAFYRNLLAPYTHQYANQCSRADLYPITIMYHLFKNDIIKWPQINGETKLKLELINQTNQLVAGRAHDAMVDVEITLALARRFFTDRAMWDFVLNYFTKQVDQERMQKLPTNLETSVGNLNEGLMILGKIGAANFYQAPVLCLGGHDYFKNQINWLRLDTPNLTQTTADNIAEKTWVIRKKIGEVGFVLPMKEKYLTLLSAERKATVASNKLWLQQQPELLEKIIHYHKQFTFPVVPDADQDASLYQNNFWNNEETALCQSFHRLPTSEKATLIEKMQNPLLKSLAIRLMGRNFPDSMNSLQRDEFESYLQRLNSPLPIIDFKGELRLTPQAALAEINLLNADPNLDQTQRKLLQELEEYLQKSFFTVKYHQLRH